MAAKGQSYAEKFSRWEVLVTNGKPSTPDLPQIADDLTSLETMLGNVRSLESRQEDLRSQSRDLTKQIKVAAQAGEKVRGRLGATLKGKYGFDSEMLVKFGFKPRPQVVRRRPVTKPTPQVTAAAPSEPAENKPAGAV
jgi:hypothetical protein